MPFSNLLQPASQVNRHEHIIRQKGRGFIHFAKLVHRPCCCWCALFDVCAQFNKAFIFKTRWWLALIFFLAVSRGPRWGPRSDTVHIALFVQVGPILCLSGIIKIHKSVYLQGLFLPKWLDIGPALSVYCCERGSGGIKKKLSVTWISVSLLFSGLCAFSWCDKNQQTLLQSTLHRSFCV